MDQQKTLLILVACASVYGGVALLFLFYCCRILLKCFLKYDEEEPENDPKSATTGISEIDASVCVNEPSKAIVNEGYLVDIAVEDNRMKPFEEVDRKVDDQGSYQPPFTTNAEDELKDMKQAA